MRRLVCYFFLQLSVVLLFSQTQPPATPAADRIKSFEQRKLLKEKSTVGNIPFTSVGPTVFSGRVTDIDISPDDPTHFYVAYASGGLWKTESNGTDFTPLFDNEIVMTIGDIAVDWSEDGNEDIIWIGTGENNSSRSSYSGVGIFKSTDGGKTWEHKGLPESHHIGRIVLHPMDPNIAWVAVLGHLYSPSKERGVYKTTDGGDTWTQTLFVNEDAGAVDLIMDPDNTDILYTAIWERTRRAWNFTESGAGSGIYKSIDGGQNWDLLTNSGSGFPTGEGVGRIGLDIYKKDDVTHVYAVLDNYDRREKNGDTKEEGLTKEDLKTMSKTSFLRMSEDKIKRYLDENNFPEKYSAEKVIKLVKKDKIKPVALAEYIEDANRLLFDTPVIGAEVYHSSDEGNSWTKKNVDYLDGVYNSYGYYFGQIRVSPHNSEKLYIMGVPILKSEDSGATWKSIHGENVHADHHAIWLNPKRDKHLIIGNDGGINISYDDGATWIKCNTPAVGQFYAVNIDLKENYNIYGGLQDNGVWMGSNNYRAGKRWHNTGRYPYQEIMGGDGMQIEIDTRDNNTVYTGYQFGNYYRIDLARDRSKYLTPKHELGDRPLRWNWQTPIQLSRHNQDIFYMGSNKVHRSMNQGNDFEEISGDLTNGGIKGDVAYGTITDIHESSLKFGLIYAGTDDGNVHVTKDGGNNWELINDNLPKQMWVTRVNASQHEKSRVYLSMNGYRWDDFNSYVFVSEDYGKTWTKIGTDLPMEPVNCIIEDPVNEELIYVGTDHGLYVSLNRGTSFELMDKDLPAVAVHDIVIHPKTNEMIVGTHGRSIYKADVSVLQQQTDEIRSKEIYVYDIPPKQHSRRWGRQWASWAEANEPKIKIPINTNSTGRVTISIKTTSGKQLYKFISDVAIGINYLEYDLSIDESAVKTLEKYLNEESETPVKAKKADNGLFYLLPGKYVVEVSKNGVVEKGELLIEE